MAIPPTTSEHLNINDAAIFTDVSFPVDIDDQHNLLYGSRVDGIDDYKAANVKGISASSGSAHSISMWVKTTPANQFGVLASQNPSVADATNSFTIYQGDNAISNLLFVQWHSAAGDLVTSSIASGHKKWDDGTWHLLTTTVNGNDVNIYIDGVEASAYITQNGVTAGGFTGVPSTVNNFNLGATTSGGAFLRADAELSRIRFWEGTTLSDTHVSDDYIAECAAVFIQTPDKDYSPTMNHIDWTNLGGTTFENDDWNKGAAFIGDAVDNKLQQSPIITSVDGARHAVQFWAKFNTAHFSNEALFCQGNIATFDDGIEIYTGSTGIITCIFASSLGSPTDRILSASVASTLPLDDLYHLYTFVVDGGLNKMRIFKDGVEVIYGTQDSIGGAGYSGVLAGVADATFGSDAGTGRYTRTTTRLTRLKVWRTTDLSKCQVELEYANEVAAIGEGFVVPDLGNRDFKRYLDRYFNRTFR